MPRQTDANEPADWLWIAESDLSLVRIGIRDEAGYYSCRSKLAEVLEKLLKAELIRTGWALEKIHDLDRLFDAMVARHSDLVSTVEPLCDAFAEVYFTNRYPGFDLDDPDWPGLRIHLANIAALLETIKRRLPPSA